MGNSTFMLLAGCFSLIQMGKGFAKSVSKRAVRSMAGNYNDVKQKGYIKTWICSKRTCLFK